MPTRPRLIVFDVNETLLDLAPLKTKVNAALSNDLAFDLWFRQLLHYSLVESVTDSYSDFSSIAYAIFQMVAKRFDRSVPEEQVKSILGTIKKLPPHTDVPLGLELLKNAGIPLVALTNGNREVAEQQLAHARIDHFFDEISSVEKVGRFKPHPAPYQNVLQNAKVKSGDALMVAAHAWDIFGAKRVGMSTAFVQREGKSLYPLDEHPDLIGKTVLEIAEKIVPNS